MNEKILKLAKKAGFCMWEDESWNPGDVIDWNVSYDNELENFANLIVRECIDIAKNTMDEDCTPNYNLAITNVMANLHKQFQVNNLIKVITNEALDEVVPYTWTTLDYEEVKKVQQRMAELVLEECVDLLKDHQTDVYIIDSVKRHFGYPNK